MEQALASLWQVARDHLGVALEGRQTGRGEPVQPRSLVRGTREEGRGAAAWVEARVAEYAHRFASAWERDSGDPGALVASVADKLCSGSDVSLGFYLERPSYLSLAAVTCSPNRSKPELTCPVDDLAVANGLP